MTEAEWMSSEEPAAMLDHFNAPEDYRPSTHQVISQRKLRLFACACFRFLHSPIPLSPQDIEALEAAEKYADDGVTPMPQPNWWVNLPNSMGAAQEAAIMTPNQLHVAALLREIVGNPWRPVALPSSVKPGDKLTMLTDPYRLVPATGSSRVAATVVSVDGDEMTVQPANARLGEYGVWDAPPCPWLTWNDGAIPRMARTIYDARSFEDLPILRDALDDAGCRDEAIFSHCLETVHVRGCWLLDLLLGKS